MINTWSRTCVTPDQTSGTLGLWVLTNMSWDPSIRKHCLSVSPTIAVAYVVIVRELCPSRQALSRRTDSITSLTIEAKHGMRWLDRGPHGDQPSYGPSSSPSTLVRLVRDHRPVRGGLLVSHLHSPGHTHSGADCAQPWMSVPTLWTFGQIKYKI